MKSFSRIVLLITAVSSATCMSSSVAAEQREHARSLADLDGRQKLMVAKADVSNLEALSHHDLTINAPTNRILTRDQFLTMMRNGKIGAEAFERTVESVTVSGEVGVIMGSEIFTPTADSELGKNYGVRPLKRRYTNIYKLHAGKWLWLARHAHVVPDK
ncbi:nuclear transport factor 2 family protein [Sphingobium sp. SCG-1]|uniref:nuclear transport factor 2 family protein n=1 Tax=Sphingobium sp. SCG-1 TaxID=2072936 RepID=UPI0016707880|nr:nuclear transport factor 2 family protein [Sphingobium sp. SCG-1]